MFRKQLFFFLNIVLIAAFVLAANGQSKPRIGQSEIVNLEVNGPVKVDVVETIGKPMQVLFTGVKTKKTLASFTLKNGDKYIPFQFESAVNPITRFRVMENIEGLPVPLIQAVSVHPGGSDHSFWTILFAEIDGKIKMLTPKTTENSIQGGVYIGAIGAGKGIGMAVYTFLWEDGEAHYADHRYKVDVYDFDDARGIFVLGRSLATNNKHKNKSEALKELGFGGFTNHLNDFPAIKDFRVDDSEYLESKSEYNYEAQKNLIPNELGKIYLGMPLYKFLATIDLNKAEVGDTRFDWLGLTVPISKGGTEKLTVRIHGLSDDDKKAILRKETVTKKDGSGIEYEDTITRLKTDRIPDSGFVYAMYIDFRKDFDLKSFAVKTYGADGEVRKPDDRYHFFDIEWHKETSDGLTWLIRSFHEGEKKQLQLLGRIAGTEWETEN